MVPVAGITVRLLCCAAVKGSCDKLGCCKPGAGVPGYLEMRIMHPGTVSRTRCLFEPRAWELFLLFRWPGKAATGFRSDGCCEPFECAAVWRVALMAL